MRNSLFINDPFGVAAEAFRFLFPGLPYIAQFVPKADIDGNGTLGKVTYIDGNPPIVSISTEITISDAIGVFIHELAHVATPGKGHSQAFYDVYSKILEEYSRINNERMPATFGWAESNIKKLIESSSSADSWQWLL